MEQMIQQRLKEQRLSMEQMFQYMQGFASSMSQPLPPPLMLFPPPQPPATTPNQSAASNNQPQDPDLSQWFPWPPH
uniref:Uncharacterized protein n=1 Tax=Setaria viridis TaxID=4556 RepID=A0A4U6UJ57_SETVI|nr:hypothetical protein SEVIR_5G130600v2 [Setaria viridis]